MMISYVAVCKNNPVNSGSEYAKDSFLNDIKVKREPVMAIRCSLNAYESRCNGATDGWTYPLIEMRQRI